MEKRITAFLMVTMLLLSFTACEDVLSGTGTSSISATSESADSSEDSQKKVVYDSDNLKVTFLKAYDQDGIEGVFYFQLLVENKSNQYAWVYLDKVSIDGYSTTAMSGVPMNIKAGEKSQQPFIFSYNNLDAKSISDVKNIKFQVVMENADTSAKIDTSKELEVVINN